MVERAGFWRRCLAAVVDLLVAQVLLQALVALAFAMTGGHVTTGFSVYSTCQTTTVRPGQLDLPSGAVLPTGFVPNQQGTCRSSVFGATTRVLYVASQVDRRGTTVTTTTQAFPIGPDAKTVWRVFDADVLFLPLFVLIRWAADRYGRGSLGRRLARIAVTDANAAATGAALAPDLARRYVRFLWPLLPGIAIGTVASAVGFATGSVPPVVSILVWAFGPTLSSAACLAAALSISRNRDAFYDAPVGTVVAPLLEIERWCEVAAAPRRDVRATPSSDAVAALRAACRAPPRLSLALLAAMAVVYGLEVMLPAAGQRFADGPSLATLVAYGGMDRELVVMLGQVYRLITATVIHGSVAHLVANGFALLVAGWLLEDLAGRVLFGGIFLFGGIAASIASVSFNPAQQIGIGASGAIQALLAAALVVSVRLPRGPRRAWTQALPLVIGVPALIPAVQVPGGLSVDHADHVGGAIAGLAMGLAIAITWRVVVVRRPGRRIALTVGGLVAAAVLLPIPVTGVQDPALAARLVPPGEMPRTDAAWRDRAIDLVARYPDDPRAMLGLAMRDAAAGETSNALSDLDRAVALQRRLAPAAASDFRSTAHGELGGEFFGAGNLDAAILQYDAALAEKPMVVVFRQRGIAEFYRKRPSDALSDLRQAVAMEPKEAYSVLWLSIVAARSGAPDPIHATAKTVGNAGWPDMIVAFYDGQHDADYTTSWAATLDLVGDQHRICEAKFYEGERLIMQEQDAAARPLIEEAARTCPNDFIEYRAATEELDGAAGFPQN